MLFVIRFFFFLFENTQKLFWHKIDKTLHQGTYIIQININIALQIYTYKPKMLPGH